ncbi:arsenate reductase family protein [Undibacterium jejuense]|uniref:Arsenate reductase family protein n=1 Tax=Undibacterium jejuense TaxID=1344949 RepID=A0A923HI78_9BURK|nr:arsenate reductase family protein [Undibacterium jejuense]MBC3862878.1 arsenate reductase family protein [Undibacterium jejuense]
MIRIFHNPRCSKSRETLSLLQAISEEKQLSIEIIDYQKTPLTQEQLNTLLHELGGDVQVMLRSNEDAYLVHGLANADAPSALQAIVAHPILLQRPIVSFHGKAAIGRPPEQVLALFEESI